MGLNFQKQHPTSEGTLLLWGKKSNQISRQETFLGGEKLMKTDMVNFEKSLYIYLVFLSPKQ